ncbi:MAG: IS66 family transposase [Desulfobacterales bacterium]|nr:MAG: IS66 family transposase [Desulfobacterales bacterium]
MDRAQAEKIYNSGKEAIIAKLVELSSELETLKRIFVVLEGRIQQLENQLAKDSHNSSKPPSSDGYNKPKKTKSQRHKTNRKVGGQKGHPGQTLEMVDNPDHLHICKLAKDHCDCGRSLKGKQATGYERRQVIDIPPVKLQVIEYQAEHIDCACGIRHVASFPDGVNAPVQYGARLKSQIIYLMNYQYIPYDRLSEFIEDWYEHKISLGTVFNYNESCYHRLAATEQQIKGNIIQSKVVGFDESGASVNGNNFWIHSSSTDDYCYYACHEKRGKQAMDAIAILPQFHGTAVHDHWKSYFKFGCDHALCNSHHLRELQYISEQYGQAWSVNMKKLLLEIKAAVDKTKQLNGNHFEKSILEAFEKRYQQILLEGYEANAPPKLDNTKRKRGRVKRSEPLNFLDRLRDYSKETLAFMYDFDVPFDNNLSERDIRMMKLRLKISGTFRSKFGADMFCRIRGFIATAKKQGINVLDAIEEIWAGNILVHV